MGEEISNSTDKIVSSVFESCDLYDPMFESCDLHCCVLETRICHVRKEN